MNRFFKKNAFSIVILANFTIFIFYVALTKSKAEILFFVLGQTSINVILGGYCYNREYPNLKLKDNYKESIYEGAILSAIIFSLIGFGVCTLKNN
jgi:hypothetical protein